MFSEELLPDAPTIQNDSVVGIHVNNSQTIRLRILLQTKTSEKMH